MRTHGLSKTPTYRVWMSMKARCYTPSATCYENYGGRGIRVCLRWHNYLNFLADMGEVEPGYSIERIDNDADYGPGNCKWATRLEQNRNQRDLRYIEFGGQKKCLSEWAESAGMKESALRQRLRLGWSFEAAISTPIRAHKQYERRA